MAKRGGFAISPISIPPRKLQPDVATGHLRFLTINDVYSADALASILPLLRKHRQDGVKTFTSLNGDYLGGYPLAVKTQGKACVELMNKLDLDAVVIGNHEFDYGAEVLKKRIKEGNFMCFGSNIFSKSTETLMEGVTDLHTFDLSLMDSRGEERGKVVVGVFGVCTEATPQLAYPGPDIEFRSVLQSAKHAVQELQSKGAQFIVGLTHVSFAQDKMIASQVPGLNLLLGGHDHTPFVQTVGDCLILKCGENADRLGVIDVKFSQATNPTPSSSVTTPNSVARPLSPTSPFSPLPSQPSAPPLPPYSMSFAMIANENDPDPSLIRLLDKYLDEGEDSERRLLPLLKLGRAPLISTSETVRTRGASFPAFLADCLKLHFSPSSISPKAVFAAKHKGLVADLAIINGGFCRNSAVYSAKSVLTVGDILDELPFPRQVVLQQMHTNTILAAVEQQMRFLPAASGAFPHFSRPWKVYYYGGPINDKISGLRLPRCKAAFKTSSNSSSSVSSERKEEEDVNNRTTYNFAVREDGLERRRVLRIEYDGVNIETDPKYADKEWLVCITEFMAGGGDGCTALKEGKVVSSEEEQVVVSTAAIHAASFYVYDLAPTPKAAARAEARKERALAAEKHVHGAGGAPPPPRYDALDASEMRMIQVSEEEWCEWLESHSV